MQLQDIIPAEINVIEFRKRREISPGFHKTQDKLRSMKADELKAMIAMLEKKLEAQ